MAVQDQDDEDTQDAQDTAAQAAPPAPSDDAPPPPGQYDDNTKMGLAAISLLTPLLGGLIGGRTGALAGASAGATGVGNQVQSDEQLQRQLALGNLRYGRQNKLGYEARRQLVDGVPQDVVFDRVTGQWKTPDGHIAYSAEGEKNATTTPPAADNQAAAPAQAPAPAAAPAPVPTDPVSQRLAELDDQMPSDEDLDPARHDGESIAQAQARVKQAQADKARVQREQDKLKDSQLPKSGKSGASPAAADNSGDGSGAAPPSPSDPKVDAEFNKMGKDLTGGSASSRTDFGKNQATITNAGKILALGAQAKTQEGGLDSRQIHEIAISTGNLLSGGNAAAQATVQALVPASVGTAPAKIEEWLTSDPKGTGQQEFVNRMMETAQREQFVAQENIKGIKSDIFQTYGDLATKAPDRYQAMKDYHFGSGANFDAQGHYVPQTFKAAPTGDDAAALQWLKDNPDSPDAPGVQARLKKGGHI